MRIFSLKKFKLDKELAIFSILIAVLAMEMLFLIPFSSKKLIVLNGNIRGIREKMAEVERDWPRRQGYISRSRQLKEEIEEISSKIIPIQQENNLLSFLSSEGKKFGVDIEALKPSPPLGYRPTPLGELSYVPIIVKAKSRFHSLAHFLDNLHKSKYFFVVKELNIVSGQSFHPLEMVICGLAQEKK